MRNELQGSFDNLSPSIAQAIALLSRVRVMLWAGDYDRASAELAALYHEQSEKINQALDLRAEVTRKEREFRKEARESIEDSQMALPELPIPHHRSRKEEMTLASEAAKMSREMIEGREELFMLGAVAAILYKLDKRISEVKGEKPIFRDQTQRLLESGESEAEQIEESPSLPVVEAVVDTETGFRYVQIQKDDKHWEWRAYRPNPVHNEIEQIQTRLADIPDLHLELFDHAQIGDQPILPYRFRGFSNRAFIEVTIFDPNRVLIEIAGDQKIETQDYLKSIFAVLS